MDLSNWPYIRSILAISYPFRSAKNGPNIKKTSHLDLWTLRGAGCTVLIKCVLLLTVNVLPGMQIPSRSRDITEKWKCDVNFFASLTDWVTHNNMRLLSRPSSLSFKRSNQHVTSVHRHPPSAKSDDKFSYTQAEKVIFVRYKLS